MAISYVGGVTGGRAGSTSTTTQSLSGKLTGGSDTSPSAGDLVVVWVSAAGNSSYKPTSQTISGNNSGAYTYETFQSSADTYYSLSQLNYKIQGATVDTSLTIPSSGHARCAQRWVVHVFRGVRAANILDVSAVPKTGIDTGRPDPDPITPSTSGAWIAAYYASATATTGTAYTAASGLSGWLGNTSNDTYACMQGGGYYSSWTSGAYNPAAITAGGTTGSGDAWTAMTIALRPESAPTVALGTPDDNASISDSTPDLKFTGTDGDSDSLDYQVQVDTTTTFDSTFPSHTFGVEGFETGSSPFSFTSLGTLSGSATLTVDSSSKVYGTKSLAYAASGVGIAAAVKNHGSDLSEIWIGLSIFLPTSWTTGGTGAVVMSSLVTSGDADVVAFQIENNGTGLEREITIWNTITESWVQTGIQLATNQINRIQINFKQNATTGYYKIWVNNDTSGSPNYNSGSVNTGGTAFSKIYYGGYADNAVPTFYIDNCCYSTSAFMSSMIAAPLINALSTDHTGFSAGTSHPTASGAEQTYTVQSALSDGTYYWRVRAIDPSGGNTWGAWSPGDSTLGYDHFHLSSGPVNGSVTQVAASLTLTGGTQTVVGLILANASVTQTGASLTLSGGTQTVASVRIASVTQSAASLTLTGGTQVVASTQIGAVAQTAASLTLSSGTQSIASVQNSAISQTAASLTLSAGTQVVTAVVTQNASVTQSGVSLALSGGTQTVAGVIIADAEVTQVSASLALSAGTQAINATQVSNISQTAASLTLTGGTQVVEGIEGTPIENASVTQISTSMTLSTGTQVIEAVQISNASVSQVSASLTLSSGTQQVASSEISSISQVGASLTLSGGTQSVSSAEIASISQTGVSLSLTGGTQLIEACTSASITQVGASLVLSGGTQSIATIENAIIQQIAAQLSLSSGTQSVVSVSTGVVTQVGANLIFSTGTPVISTSTGPLPTYYPDMVFCDGKLAIQLDEDQYSIL